jgi:hypothetical protein
MKNTIVQIIVLATISLSAPDAIHADKWAAPKPRIFASMWGTYGFKLLLPDKGGGSEGLLFQLDAQGKDVVLWHKKLVNIPDRVFVAENRHVVTIDTYGGLGFAHVLVVYDDKGAVLKDYQLEDLLTANEIKTKVKQTASSRHWVQDAKFDFEADHFVVRLAWGRTIRIHLATGKVGM